MIFFFGKVPYDLIRVDINEGFCEIRQVSNRDGFAVDKQVVRQIERRFWGANRTSGHWKTRNRIGWVVKW